MAPTTVAATVCLNTSQASLVSLGLKSGGINYFIVIIEFTAVFLLSRQTVMNLLMFNRLFYH